MTYIHAVLAQPELICTCIGSISHFRGYKPHDKPPYEPPPDDQDDHLCPAAVMMETSK